MPRRCLVTATTEQVYPYRDPGIIAGHRRRLLHRAAGRVLDLSSRWTHNQAGYRAGIVESLVVLTAPTRFARPLEWAEDAVVDRAEVLDATIDSASVPDGSVDTVVATMALCTAADLDRSLAAIARWLSPGGELLVLEHVLGTGLTGTAQRLAAPAERALGAGCRLDQDLAAGLRRTGFDLTEAARFTTRLAAGIPTPCLAGVARVRRPLATPSPPSIPVSGVL